MADPNDVGLREYLEHRIEALEQRVDDRFSWNDQAISKAERTMNERLNSMNEFRESLKDQANRMATRMEVERLDQTVQELQRAKANFDGRLVIVASLVSTIISVVAVFIMRLMTSP